MIGRKIASDRDRSCGKGAAIHDADHHADNRRAGRSDLNSGNAVRVVAGAMGYDRIADEDGGPVTGSDIVNIRTAIPHATVIVSVWD